MSLSLNKGDLLIRSFKTASIREVSANTAPIAVQPPANETSKIAENASIFRTTEE
jgi:hypothetical protein